ncbi:MAG TPA: hypothetical protein VF605_19700 [Allosphingosinicella sp.]|jgi:hypothetical protein
MRQEDIEYHAQRARAELDQAHSAKDQAAAEAHMRLSSLHMKRVQSADEECGGSGVCGAR